MKRILLWSTVLLLGVALGSVGFWGVTTQWQGDAEGGAIQPELVADYIHAVIQANRTVYSRNIVDKMHESGVVEAAEHWKEEAALPLPAQFMMDTGKLVAERGKGIKYRLVSLFPIYVWNSPETDFERRGLEEVSKNPAKPFTGFVRIGHQKYFQAIYADVAVSPGCASCHNAHMNSPRRDWKVNDVMGGIVITIPVPS